MQSDSTPNSVPGRTMQQHISGDPLHVYGIPVSLHKVEQLDKFGCVVLDNSGKSVMKCGFRIGGGLDQDPTHCPHGYPDKGIYITYVEERGAAAMAGLLAHDKILQINGLDFTMVTHDKACKAIKKDSALQMIIFRKNAPDRLYDAKLDDSTHMYNGDYGYHQSNHSSGYQPQHSAPNSSFATPDKY